MKLFFFLVWNLLSDIGMKRLRYGDEATVFKERLESDSSVCDCNLGATRERLESDSLYVTVFWEPLESHSRATSLKDIHHVLSIFKFMARKIEFVNIK